MFVVIMVIRSRKFRFIVKFIVIVVFFFLSSISSSSSVFFGMVLVRVFIFR